MKKILLSLCLFPSLCFAQCNYSMMITNYVEAGKCFYTNQVSNRYSLEGNHFVKATNMIVKYVSSLDKNNSLFKANDQDVVITLTCSKDYKRYGKSEVMNIKTNGTALVNKVVIPKFIEVGCVDSNAFMRYWIDNKEAILMKKGKILY